MAYHDGKLQGILWSTIRRGVGRATPIIVVCANLYNLLMDISDADMFDILPVDSKNNATVAPYVHFQDHLLEERELGRRRQDGWCNTDLRNTIPAELSDMG